MLRLFSLGAASTVIVSFAWWYGPAYHTDSQLDVVMAAEVQAGEVDLVIDLTGSTATDFQVQLGNVEKAFRKLPIGMPYRILALMGSESQLSRIDAGIVPNDVLKSTIRTRQSIINGSKAELTRRFHELCPVGRNGSVQCKDSRSCIYQSIRDRVKLPVGSSKPRPLTIVYFTDSMEDCNHSNGNGSQRINLLDFTQPAQAATAIRAASSFTTAQQQQAAETDLFFCIPRKSLQNSQRMRSSEWLEQFWQAVFAGIKWKHFGIDDELPSSLPVKEQ